MSTFADCVLFVIAIVPSTVVLEVVCMCGILKYYSLSRHVICHCSLSFNAIVFHVVFAPCALFFPDCSCSHPYSRTEHDNSH